MDGCKQGGILSGYLFNFFMNELIEKCIELKAGCSIGIQKISIIAYCDDLFLMATAKKKIDLLLSLVSDYLELEVEIQCRKML